MIGGGRPSDTESRPPYASHSSSYRVRAAEGAEKLTTIAEACAMVQFVAYWISAAVLSPAHGRGCPFSTGRLRAPFC